MNKSTKGLIAAAAGVTLLTGVGGTFANWSENKAAAPGSVTAGHLNLTVDAGSWKDVTISGSPVSITDVAAFRMVPGDVLQYKTIVTPDMVGDNLKATLTATLPAEAGTLAGAVTTTSVFDDSGLATRQLDESNDTAVGITVTVTMPADTTTGEDQTLDLSDLTVDLVQNANPVV
ncbi:alternate-type signal peptide domain-containing protein [Nocardioides piscis]|uniref:Alternate-type signal peptide domain-containing protein n=1 Tax=Nocardioides piscis TaxID=2714938 RepID=A0A6G7YJ57_9ACTN|nr:alternate-type signal peptide domain-containing protein [Nocardioides piscis]QIK76767.1 alternate-type signal peptide domain-containing protein [Nocardioides piscis]